MYKFQAYKVKPPIRRGNPIAKKYYMVPDDVKAELIKAPDDYSSGDKW